MAPLETNFYEKQKYTQWWLWLLLAMIFLSPFIANIQSIINRGFWNTFSKGIYSHIVTIGLVIVLFFLLRLETKIDAEGIKINYFPFVKKKFKWAEIEGIKMVNFNSFRFIHRVFRRKSLYGSLYKVKGKNGASIKLKNGETYTIGTQKPMELQKDLKIDD